MFLDLYYPISPFIALTSFASFALSRSTVSPSESETVAVNRPLMGAGFTNETDTPGVALNVMWGRPGAQSSRVFSGASGLSVY